MLLNLCTAIPESVKEVPTGMLLGPSTTAIEMVCHSSRTVWLGAPDMMESSFASFALGSTTDGTRNLHIPIFVGCSANCFGCIGCQDVAAGFLVHKASCDFSLKPALKSRLLKLFWTHLTTTSWCRVKVKVVQTENLSPNISIISPTTKTQLYHHFGNLPRYPNRFCQNYAQFM